MDWPSDVDNVQEQFQGVCLNGRRYTTVRPLDDATKLCIAGMYQYNLLHAGFLVSRIVVADLFHGFSLHFVLTFVLTFVIS